MPRHATRQPDLFAPDPGDDALPTPPERSPEERAESLALLTRELEEVEAAPQLPCRHDTSRAMGKERSFRGRLWLVDPEDAARLLARWDAAWARHWEVWEREELAKLEAAGTE
jgi:hypothetical protein